LAQVLKVLVLRWLRCEQWQPCDVCEKEEVGLLTSFALMDAASAVQMPLRPPPVSTRIRRRHLAASKFAFLQPQPPSPPSSSACRPKFLGWHSGLAQDEELLSSTLTPAPTHGCTFSDGFSTHIPGSLPPSFLPKLAAKAAFLPGQGCKAGTGPRAIWSDDHDLRSSDSFNMKKWRVEFADELAKVGRKFSSRPLMKCDSNDVAVLQAKDLVLSSSIIRNEVASGLELRELCAKENAKRRRQLIDDAGRMQRRVAAQRRSADVQSQIHHRSVVTQEEAKSQEADDSDMLAKEERVQQTIARIQCRQSVEVVAPPIDSSSSPTMKALRSRVKYAVTWRLEQRRKQARKRLAVKENRLTRVEALLESERNALQDSFNKYSREVNNRQVMQVLDLPKCLMEAGLSGTNCLERWRVDRVCKEMVFALALEHSSFEKLPPIGAFRGSLIPRALRAANRCNSLQDVAGPSLDKLRSDEDQCATPDASLEEQAKWRQSFSFAVATSSNLEEDSSEEEGEQPALVKTSTCSAHLQSVGASPTTSSWPAARQTVGALSSAKWNSAQPFNARRLEEAAPTSVTNGMANLEVTLWRLPEQKSSRLRQVLVNAAQTLIAARKFMLARPICFEDFASEIVPAVRAELMEIRQDVHFDEFMQVLGVSASESKVCLSIEQCERLATRLHIGRDIFDRFFALLPEAEPEAQKDSAPELTEAALSVSKDLLAGLIPSGKFKGKDEAPVDETHSLRCKEDPRLNFETVHEMLIKMEELSEHEKRAAERRIMERTGLSQAKFWEHRFELIRLHEYFDLYDADHNCFLCQEEVKQLLKHVGMQPYKREEGKLVNALLTEAETDGHEGLSFIEFLDLMMKVRDYQKQQQQGKLRRYFRNYADIDGKMDLGVVEKALMAAGISGKTRMEQDLQQKIIYDWDVDNSGDIVFEEFVDICQRIQERLQSYKMEEIVIYATSLGMDKQRLSEYICAYDQYDTDHNGGLSMAEIDEVLHKWCPVRPPTAVELQDLFEKVGIKDNQEVPLTQFLDIMQIASVGRGMFARELPFTLRDVTSAKLREILNVFSVGKGYMETLDHCDLLDLASSYLEVSPDCNLREEIEGMTIGSEKMLIEYAKRMQKHEKHSLAPGGQSLGQALTASLNE